MSGENHNMDPVPEAPGGARADNEKRTRPGMSTRQKSLSRLLGLTLGLSLGVGAYTFHYARGTSYLTNEPAVCANCHVMQGHLDAWSKSSHHAVAVCNDCHSPHGLVAKYLVKAKNGYRHSVAFTSDRFHEPIRITDANRAIVEDACRRCHADVVQMMDYRAEKENRTSCTHCHADVGHP